MNRTLKARLAILLAICLLTLLPAAFAEEESTLDAAVSEVSLTLGDDTPDAAEAPYDIDYEDVPEECTETIPSVETQSEPVDQGNAGTISNDNSIDISDWTIDDIQPLEYTGKPIELSYFTLKESSGKALTEGTDYILSYKDNTNAGNATLIVTGIGNYKGTILKTFEITPRGIDQFCNVEPIPDQAYTGDQICPAVTVRDWDINATLTQNDYTVSFSDNVSVGRATVSITGTGNYTGTTWEYFSITSPAKTYRTVKITLISGHEPVKTYDATANCGTYDTNKVYHPLLSHSDFHIDGVDVASGDTVTIDDAYLRTLKFDGKDAGNRTVTLNLAGHLVASSSNKYTYTLSTDSVTTIKGTINKKTLTVTPPAEQSIDESFVSTYIIKASVTGLFTGDKITGALSHEGDNSVGRHKITIGTLDAGNNYEIKLRDGILIITSSINGTNVTVTLDQQTYSYTGSAITPKPTVKYGSMTLTEGTDYTLSYSNNTNAGMATVTITGKGNYSGTRTASFRISSEGPSEGSSSKSPIWIVAQYDKHTVGIKETLNLYGMVSRDHPEISDSSWKWASTNKSVATVKIQARGALVTGKKAGTVTITATTPDKKYTAFYVVDVIDKQAPTSVKISGDSVVGVKEKLQLSAVMTAIGTPRSKLTWKSSNTKVATVSSKGLVTGKKAGRAIITVTTSNKLSDSITIEVRDATAPTKVTLSPAGPRTIGLKDKLQLTATLEPFGTARSKLKWSTSNKKIATVSAKGLVTGKKAGRAKITVTTDNGLTASVEIIVEDIHAPTSVAIEPASPAPIAVKGRLQLSAKLTAIGTPKTKLKWKSSNTKVATVSSKGLVTGKKPGTTIITVTTDNKLTASVKVTVK